MISLLLIWQAEFVHILEPASQVHGKAKSLSSCLKIASAFEINHRGILSVHSYKIEEGFFFLCGVSDPNHVQSPRKTKN